MPEYLSPGVYIEEIELGGKPLEGVSTSTAGFLGETERGPNTPRLVTGFEQFRRIYGGYIEGSFLPLAVDGFFRNGGQRLFISRIVTTQAGAGGTNASKVELSLNSIILRAIGPGSWARRVAIKIENAALDPAAPGAPPTTDQFKLTVVYWRLAPPTNPLVDPTIAGNRNEPNRREPELIEVYDNLSPDPENQDYFKKRINGISDILYIVNGAAAPARPDNTPFQLLTDPADPIEYDGDDVTVDDYAGESVTFEEDGEQINERYGLAGFSQIRDISIVCAPNEGDFSPDLTNLLVDHCEHPALRNRFAILQSNVDDTPSGIGTMQPSRISDYAGFYYPWIKVRDPRTRRDIDMPPGGHIAGIYARSDVERGVHKAPANEIVRGAKALQFSFEKPDQDLLNPRGINVIRSFPSRGIRVWGARTTSRDPLWRYINVRRLFIFLEESIDRGTQWVVFEPNNE